MIVGLSQVHKPLGVVPNVCSPLHVVVCRPPSCLCVHVFATRCGRKLESVALRSARVAACGSVWLAATTRGLGSGRVCWLFRFAGCSGRSGTRVPSVGLRGAGGVLVGCEGKCGAPVAVPGPWWWWGGLVGEEGSGDFGPVDAPG